MDDETPRLRALLEELHGELSRQPVPEVGDGGKREQWRELQEEIERLLARTGTTVKGLEGAQTAATETPVPVEERRQLQGRLQAAVVGFEGAHPQLAAAVEQTMNALSNMGL